MQKLSVVIITFNEEHNIKRCIESVKSIADEIVVVDSYSTDNTRSICENEQVVFMEHSFEGHVQQKNWAKNQASYDWVLSLDADEVLSSQLAESILAIKSNLNFDGYSMNRMTNYCGKWIRHSGWYPDRKLRLWNKNKGKWAGDNPHDKFILEPNSTSGHLKGDILHYSYPTIKSHLDQLNKFTLIASEARFNKEKNVNLVLFIFHPIVAFIRKYIFQLGILDGYYGFVIACFKAYGTFAKDLMIRELYKNQKLSK